MSLNGLKKLSEAGVMSEMLYRLENATEQWWANIVHRVTSTHPAGEDLGWIGGYPQMAEETGNPGFNKLRAPNFFIKNKEWEAGVRIHKRDWDADARGIIQGRVAQGTDVVLAHPGVLLQTAITDAEATVCYDGQFFFDTDHAEGDSGTQDNDLTHDCSDHTNPTEAELVDAILKGVQAIQGFKDDQGNECGMEAKDFLVCYPTAMTRFVMKALYNNLIGNGSSNFVAGGRGPMKFTGQVLPRWTGNKIAVFRQRAAGEGGAFVWQLFAEAEPQILGRQSEYCAQHNHLLFKHSGRYNIGYGRWQDACLVTLN